MRTLKKVLAVVLALAMVLGMAVTASAGYDDDAQITEKEAVEVLGALNVMIGSGNKFNPAGTLTRAEAAVLIAKLCLGDDAEDLTAVQMFSDVDATNWAAKYVAYCVTEGIVVGVGNGKFNPTGKLTGTEFALMLLATLGYDAKIELTGANWAEKTVQIAALAKKAGLVSSTLKTKEITREEAAKLCFNALKATMVEYETKGTAITVGGVEIVTGASKATEVANNATKETYKDDDKLQLAESLYGTDLVYTKATTDAFGRPAHTWKYKTSKVGTYADTADLVYTVEVKNGTIYSDLGLSANINAANTVVVVDNLGETYNDYASYAINKGEEVKIGGNGTTVEVYYNIDGNDVDDVKIVVVNTYVGTISSVTAATSTKDRYVTIKTGSAPSSLSSKNFETEDFAKKDVVAYTAAWGTAGKYEIQSVTLLAKTASGKVTKTKGTSSFILDEKEYKYAENKNAIASVNDKLDIYCDQYGYVLYLVATETTTNYAVVVGVGQSTSLYGENTKTGVTLLMPDGKTVEKYAKLPTIEGFDWDETLTKNNKGVLVTYTVDDDGVYEITVPKTAVLADDKTFEFENNYATIWYDDLEGNYKRAYTDAKTLFFVATPKADGSGQNYAVYTGYAAMPTVDADYTHFAQFDVNSKGIVTAVYVAADQVEGLVGDSILIVKNGKEKPVTVSTTSSSYTYYELLANNADQKVLVSANVWNNQLSNGLNVISTLTKDSHDVITGVTFNTDLYDYVGTVEADETVVGFAPVADASTLDDVVSARYYSYADDCVVTTVAKDLKSLTVGDIDAVETDFNDYALVEWNNDNEICAIYILKEDGTAPKQYSLQNYNDSELGINVRFSANKAYPGEEITMTVSVNDNFYNPDYAKYNGWFDIFVDGDFFDDIFFEGGTDHTGTWPMTYVPGTKPQAVTVTFDMPAFDMTNITVVQYTD